MITNRQHWLTRLRAPNTSSRWLFWHLQVPLMIFQELHILVSPPPVIVKSGGFLFINIIVMHGLLHIIASLLSHDFTPAVVEHSLFGDAVEPISVAVGLLLLRYGLPTSMLAHIVLVVVLSDDLPVRPHNS